MEQDFDVVIIGSGMGGLCCGAILSKEGYRVCILEKNRQFGGSLQIFSRDKVVFDTGVHYLGGMEEGQTLHQIFKYLGIINKLKLHKLDADGFDRISFKDDPSIYNHAQGHCNFVEKLCVYFPEERINIQAYMDKVLALCEKFPMYKLSVEDKNQDFLQFLEQDTFLTLQKVTSNRKLQNVLGGSNPLYAGVAKKTPFYVHALVTNSYIESAWKCVGGSSRIATLLCDSIKSYGGTVLNYSEVKKLNMGTDRIKSVELEDGRKIEGRTFISNIDLRRTLQMVDQKAFRPAFVNRINSLENTTSVFIIYLVLKQGLVSYFNHNIYHYESDDVWESIHYSKATWPESFSVFPQFSEKQPEFAEGLIVMAYMNYEEVQQWEGSRNIVPREINSRGQGYEEFKQERAELLIDRLEIRLPGIRSAIQSYTCSTPLTFRDYLGTLDGNLYGVAKDYQNSMRTYIPVRTKIPNLLLTGQNINLHGILGVSITAILTCSEIMGRDYLVEKVRQS